MVAHAPGAETVFYGFYDSLTTDPVPVGFQQIGGNRALAFAFPKRAAELFFPQDSVRRWMFRSAAAVPMVRERLAVWAKVERLRRQLAGLGLPAAAESRFGRAADFSAIEPSDPAAFEAQLAEIARDERALNLSVQEILRLSTARKLKLYLVAMPVPQRHRERFYSSDAWRAYRDYLSSKIAAAGGGFVDASDWLKEEHFEDPIHANVTGAKVFSERLANHVCKSSEAGAHP